VAAKKAKKKSLAPEDYLQRAFMAKARGERLRWAKLGLATQGPVDATTHTMLLRQLYLGLFEGRHFREAHVVALQASEVGVLSDVMLQDAARAAMAAGDLEDALAHLREASRRGPASRRAFHDWTLGSILFLAHRYDDAIVALTRAARSGAKAKPLYRAHLALALIAGGHEARDLQRTIDALVAHPTAQGYGRFVLGHLAYAAGAWQQARAYLEAFLERVREHRPAAALALEGEARMAQATLRKIGKRA
jgi:tetratricopeptide (TPR) repeat protein